MKVDNELLQALSKKVMEVGSAMQRPERGGAVTSFMTDDLTVVFQDKNGKNVFNGFVFEALGRDFIIMSDGGVYIQSSDDEGEGTFQVTEKKLLDSLESFLKWRLDVLGSLAI